VSLISTGHQTPLLGQHTSALLSIGGYVMKVFSWLWLLARTSYVFKFFGFPNISTGFTSV